MSSLFDLIQKTQIVQIEQQAVQIEQQAKIQALQVENTNLKIAEAKYVPPVIEDPNILTPLEFLNRFTNAEAKAIIRQTKSSEDVELWWIKYNKASFISLDDPQTISGIQTLEAIGILAAGRANEILTY